jgi:small redox-active disulfide protein 2
VKHIKILGPGCPKCRQLAENVQAAADQLGGDYEIEKVTEISRIMQLGVMMTPGLIVDDELKSSGKVLNVEQIKAVLQEGPDAAGRKKESSG